MNHNDDGDGCGCLLVIAVIIILGSISTNSTKKIETFNGHVDTKTIDNKTFSVHIIKEIGEKATIEADGETVYNEIQIGKNYTFEVTNGKITGTKEIPVPVIGPTSKGEIDY